MQTFESINFEVEKDLKKPEYPLEKKNIKSIFADLFKKRKILISNIRKNRS